MIDVTVALMIMGITVLISVVSFMFGAYVMYKGKTSVPGERFVGGIPKGQVFSISDDIEEEESEANVLEKTNKFLSIFEGRAKAE